MDKQAITTSKRLVYNTATNLLTFATNAVIGFFLIRFFLGQLGPARYGLWLLVGGSIFRYGGLLNMGLNSAINRYIPVYLAQNDRDGIQRVVNTSFFFFIALASVLVAASVVIYFNFSSWFAVSAELVPIGKVLVLIVGFCLASAIPLQLSSAVLSGLQRYDVMNLATLATLLVRTILLVVLLLRGHGLLTMGIAFGSSEIALRVLQTILARRLLPQFSLSLAKVDVTLLREMLGYGINTFLYAAGAVIIYQASTTIIGIFIGEEEISQFMTAAAGVVLLSQSLRAFTRAIKPAVSDLDARNDRARVKEIAFLSQKYSLLLLIPGGCFLVVMGKEFLTIWVGDKFSDPAVINTMASILAILSVGHCLRMAQYSNFLVLVGRGQHKIFGVLTALTALLCVSASVVSLKVFNAGLLGIAWSNFLPIVLISGVILPIYFNWKMRISMSESVRSVWQPAISGSLPAVAVIVAWKCAAAPNSWLEILVGVVAVMTVTVVSSWFLGLDAMERKRFASILARKEDVLKNT